MEESTAARAYIDIPQIVRGHGGATVEALAVVTVGVVRCAQFTVRACRTPLFLAPSCVSPAKVTGVFLSQTTGVS